jgi:hypothetical protein
MSKLYTYFGLRDELASAYYKVLIEDDENFNLELAHLLEQLQEIIAPLLLKPPSNEMEIIRRDRFLIANGDRCTKEYFSGIDIETYSQVGSSLGGFVSKWFLPDDGREDLLELFCEWKINRKINLVRADRGENRGLWNEIIEIPPITYDPLLHDGKWLEKEIKKINQIIRSQAQVIEQRALKFGFRPIPSKWRSSTSGLLSEDLLLTAKMYYHRMVHKKSWGQLGSMFNKGRSSICGRVTTFNDLLYDRRLPRSVRGRRRSKLSISPSN